MTVRKIIPAAFVALTLLLLGGQLFSSGASVPADKPGTVNEPDEAAAVILNQQRQVIGIMRMQPNDRGMMTMLVAARGISPGFHGVHIHETGRCTGDFSSAGGHFDTGDNNHPNHSGDLPSLKMPANGEAGVMLFVTDAFTLDDVLADDGTAIIVHAGADNFGNIPARYGGPDAETLANGDSGARIGCGVIVEADSIPQFDALLDELDLSLNLTG